MPLLNFYYIKHRAFEEVSTPTGSKYFVTDSFFKHQAKKSGIGILDNCLGKNKN